MSETNEYRVMGPPGTGKTTYLARQIHNAAERYGGEKVLVTSFTTAAATEIAGRGLEISRQMVGTLHAHCYRVLGQPVIAEEKLVGEWNQENPTMKLGGTEGSMLDEAASDAMAQGEAGDQILAEINRMRGKMTPRAMWLPKHRAFDARWSEFKASRGAMDYTDLIERALEDVSLAPGAPDVIFVDEAQDFSRLQVELVRRWGRTCERFVLVGDDDQVLYRFTGASPDVLIDPPIPVENIKVLSQSYRVPRAVHALAQRWIHQVRRRQPKEYQPRDFDGAVWTSEATYAHPEEICEHAAEQVAAGRTAMILTACAYQLAGSIRFLRSVGVPFGNSYRLKRGDWNPLAPRQGVTAAQRVLALLMPHESMGDRARSWTFGEVTMWMDWMRSEHVWRRGAKKDAEHRDAETEVDEDWLNHWMEPAAIAAMWDAMEERDPAPLIDWWRAHLSQPKVSTAEYITQIVRRMGPLALTERPRLTVGTIHSVKGAEADIVYLFPDLSASGIREWATSGEPQDSVIRQFYVGMTRAKEELVLCAPHSAHCAVPLREGIAA